MPTSGACAAHQARARTRPQRRPRGRRRGGLRGGGCPAERDREQAAQQRRAQQAQGRGRAPPARLPGEAHAPALGRDASPRGGGGGRRSVVEQSAPRRGPALGVAARPVLGHRRGRLLGPREPIARIERLPQPLPRGRRVGGRRVHGVEHAALGPGRLSGIQESRDRHGTLGVAGLEEELERQAPPLQIVGVEAPVRDEPGGIRVDHRDELVRGEFGGVDSLERDGVRKLPALAPPLPSRMRGPVQLASHLIERVRLVFAIELHPDSRNANGNRHGVGHDGPVARDSLEEGRCRCRVPLGVSRKSSLVFTLHTHFFQSCPRCLPRFTHHASAARDISLAIRPSTRARRASRPRLVDVA